MQNWVILGIIIILILCFWIRIKTKSKEKFKWKSYEIWLISLFSVAQLIDVLQTHVVVCVLGIGVELNPFFGEHPNTLLILCYKIVLVIFVILSRTYCKAYYALNKEKFENTNRIKRFFYKKIYEIILVLIVVFQWFVVFFNEISLYFALHSLIGG